MGKRNDICWCLDCGKTWISQMVGDPLTWDTWLVRNELPDYLYGEDKSAS